MVEQNFVVEATSFEEALRETVLAARGSLKSVTVEDIGNGDWRLTRRGSRNRMVTKFRVVLRWEE